MGKKIYVGAGGWGHLEPGQEPPEECKFYVEMDPATEKADNFFSETAAEIEKTAAAGKLSPMEKRGLPSLVKDCKLIQAYLEDGEVQEQAPFIKQIIARLLELAYAVGVSYGSIQKVDLSLNEQFRQTLNEALAASRAEEAKEHAELSAKIDRRNELEEDAKCTTSSALAAAYKAYKKNKISVEVDTIRTNLSRRLRDKARAGKVQSFVTGHGTYYWIDDLRQALIDCGYVNAEDAKLIEDYLPEDKYKRASELRRTLKQSGHDPDK